VFDLNSIKRGQELKPPRLFIYSVEGLGKTTLGASAPSPIFIPTEEGFGSLDVARFPLVQRVDDVREALATLYTESHDFQTVVLDTVDHLELLITRELEATNDAKELAYGKLALKQAEIWQELLQGFNALRNDRGMVVVLLGHCEIRRFDSPEVEPFDRFQPKLSARSNAYVREWCDAVLFCNFKTVIKKADVGFNKEVARGITTGERLIYTTEKPAYLAKNRYSLPESLPMQWQALSDAIAGRALPAELKAA
jgi:hypothetical protein